MIEKGNQSIFSVYFIYIAFMTLNFFITPNPFGASHSGQIGLKSEFFSKNFIISPAYIVLITLIILIFQSGVVHFNMEVIFIGIIQLISGVINGVILKHPITYSYNLIIFVLLYSIVNVHFEFEKDKYKLNLNKIGNLVAILVIFGFSLAYLYPYRYGLITLDFSRVSRGEVTYWNNMSLITMYPVLSVSLYKLRSEKRYFILAIPMIIIILATGQRAAIILSLLPILIYLIFNKKRLNKIFLLILVVIVIVFLYENISELFMLNSDIGSILNGRDQLWGYHLNQFKDNILFGDGVFSVGRANDYFGTADSEIGMLVWFSEYGIIYGLLMSFLVFRAFIRAIRIQLRNTKLSTIHFFISLLFLTMLPNLIQKYSRILSLNDLLFWYCVFYLNRIGNKMFFNIRIRFFKKN